MTIGRTVTWFASFKKNQQNLDFGTGKSVLSNILRLPKLNLGESNECHKINNQKRLKSKVFSLESVLTKFLFPPSPSLVIELSMVDGMGKKKLAQNMFVQKNV